MQSINSNSDHRCSSWHSTALQPLDEALERLKLTCEWEGIGSQDARDLARLKILCEVLRHSWGDNDVLSPQASQMVAAVTRIEKDRSALNSDIDLLSHAVRCRLVSSMEFVSLETAYALFLDEAQQNSNAARIAGDMRSYCGYLVFVLERFLGDGGDSLDEFARQYLPRSREALAPFMDAVEIFKAGGHPPEQTSWDSRQWGVHLLRQSLVVYEVLLYTWTGTMPTSDEAMRLTRGLKQVEERFYDENYLPILKERAQGVLIPLLMPDTLKMAFERMQAIAMGAWPNKRQHIGKTMVDHIVGVRNEIERFLADPSMSLVTFEGVVSTALSQKEKEADIIREFLAALETLDAMQHARLYQAGRIPAKHESTTTKNSLKRSLEVLDVLLFSWNGPVPTSKQALRVAAQLEKSRKRYQFELFQNTRHFNNETRGMLVSLLCSDFQRQYEKEQKSVEAAGMRYEEAKIQMKTCIARMKRDAEKRLEKVLP